MRHASWFVVVTPGLLVAATGVGAGDLLTASIAGSRIGLAAAAAALIGAGLKWVLNEGIARWQLATGTTLLEGWIRHLPRWVQVAFALYFLLWTLMVGGALVNACGIAGAALLPLGDAVTSKIVWGTAHALAGLALVWIGGFRQFSRVMTGCVVLLFVGVVLTALFLLPDIGSTTIAAAPPTPFWRDLPWTLAVLGGVGGTVTLLSYGYWIREAERRGLDGLRVCRIDLASAYAATALFGVAMVIIGTRVRVDGQGAGLALALADQLALTLGPGGRWAFLLGFWSAVFSSLLGVWQSAPYLFADFFVQGRRQGTGAAVALSTAPAYRGYLLFITFGSLPLLWTSLTRVQLAYAVLGALFMPFVAVTLLVLNNKRAWVGDAFVNGRTINAFLVAIVVLFAVMGALQLAGLMPSFGG